MKIEHVAWMMEDPVAAAAWYCRHLGFVIKRASDTSPFGHFLADSSGTVLLEIYNNPQCKLPDYRAMNPSLLHLAVVSEDLKADWDRLLAAGAEAASPIQELDNGDAVAMLRDPWGFPLQLVRRSQSMLV